MLVRYLLLVTITLSVSCNFETDNKDNLFVKLDSSKTGVKFENILEYNNDINVYTYRNFYAGGGVALGDVNNDGLTDIYLTSNQGSNRLYINNGNFKFSDVTTEAGVRCLHRIRPGRGEGRQLRGRRWRADGAGRPVRLWQVDPAADGGWPGGDQRRHADHR